MEELTDKEQRAEERFLAEFDITERTTDEPVVIAMIGLVGSGKSSVARALAEHIGGTVIEGDSIRVALRKEGERFERTRAIAENVATHVVEQGGNVVLDSDFVDEKKRASILEKARKAGVRVLFVRTYSDVDVMVGHAITAEYTDQTEDFFGGASSTWGGSEQSKGAAVKIREMWRRTPHHYDWVNEGGGKWVLKEFSFDMLAEIDTTDDEAWKRQVEELAENL